MIICLDPGHPSACGDRGAAHNGIVEAEYTWDFCHELQWTLGAVGRHTIINTRADADTPLAITERGQISKAANADLAICVHVNAFDDESAKGAMAFYLPGDEPCKTMADAWLSALPPEMGRARRAYSANPTRPGDEWLGHAKNVMATHSCPVFLAELAFCSNASDALKLLDPKYKAAMFAAFIVAIARFDLLR